MANYKNIMEFVVEDRVDEMGDKLDCCTCERCRADLVALALNRLPCKYVVTTKGQVHTVMSSFATQSRADVTSVLVQAAQIIKQHPRHDE